MRQLLQLLLSMYIENFTSVNYTVLKEVSFSLFKFVPSRMRNSSLWGYLRPKKLYMFCLDMSAIFYPFQKTKISTVQYQVIKRSVSIRFCHLQKLLFFYILSLSTKITTILCSSQTVKIDCYLEDYAYIMHINRVSSNFMMHAKFRHEKISSIDECIFVIIILFSLNIYYTYSLLTIGIKITN